MDNNEFQEVHPLEITLLEKNQEYLFKTIDDINKKQDNQMEKLDSMNESLSNVDKILAVQAEQLKMHMKRSDSNEEMTKLLKQELDHRMKPVESWANGSKATLKITGIILTSLLTIAGIVATIISIWR